MALVKYGGGVASMSGKLGGTVAARNRAGAYLRNWAKPTTTPTAVQTERRVSFAALSAAWKTLTETQRKAWDDYAAGLTLINRQGDSYIPTGRQMFISLNANIFFADGTTITAPPIGGVPPVINPLTATEIHQDSGVLESYEILNIVAVANVQVIVFGAPEQLGGKTNLATDYRMVGTYPTGPHIDISTAYALIFGTTSTLDSMQKAKLRTVNKLTGLSSPWLIVETITQGP